MITASVSMAMSRVKIARDKSELVKALVAADSTTGAFQTYADIIMFAAALGAKHQKRVPLEGGISKDPAPIAMEIFTSRGYDTAIKLIAIATTQDPKILSLYDTEAETERTRIFEEYANGGLEMLREPFRGTVDYTERLLLVLAQERQQQPQDSVEFNLTRFLS